MAASVGCCFDIDDRLLKVRDFICQLTRLLLKSSVFLLQLFGSHYFELKLKKYCIASTCTHGRCVQLHVRRATCEERATHHESVRGKIDLPFAVR